MALTTTWAEITLSRPGMILSTRNNGDGILRRIDILVSRMMKATTWAMFGEPIDMIGWLSSPHQTSPTLITDYFNLIEHRYGATYTILRSSGTTVCCTHLFGEPLMLAHDVPGTSLTSPRPWIYVSQGLVRQLRDVEHSITKHHYALQPARCCMPSGRL